MTQNIITCEAALEDAGILRALMLDEAKVNVANVTVTNMQRIEHQVS